MADVPEQQGENPPERAQPAERQVEAATRSFDEVYQKDQTTTQADTQSSNDLKQATNTADLNPGQQAGLALEQLFERNRNSVFGRDGSPDGSFGVEEQFDPQTREDRLKKTSQKNSPSETVTKNQYEGRADGLLESRSRVRAAGSEEELKYDQQVSPDGKLSSKHIKTADGKLDLDISKFDPLINKEGLSLESSSREGGVTATTRAFEGRPDGLVTEQSTSDGANSHTVKQFSDGRRTEIFTGGNGSDPQIKEFDKDGLEIAPKNGKSALGGQEQERSLSGLVAIKDQVPSLTTGEGARLRTLEGTPREQSDERGRFKVDKITDDGSIQQRKYENGTTITQFSGDRQPSLRSPGGALEKVSQIVQEPGKAPEFFNSKGESIGSALSKDPVLVASSFDSAGKPTARYSDGTTKPDSVENFVKTNDGKAIGRHLDVLEKIAATKGPESKFALDGLIKSATTAEPADATKAQESLARLAKSNPELRAAVVEGLIKTSQSDKPVEVKNSQDALVKIAGSDKDSAKHVVESLNKGISEPRDATKPGDKSRVGTHLETLGRVGKLDTVEPVQKAEIKQQFLKHLKSPDARERQTSADALVGQGKSWTREDIDLITKSPSAELTHSLERAPKDLFSAEQRKQLVTGLTETIKNPQSQDGKVPSSRDFAVGALVRVGGLEALREAGFAVAPGDKNQATAPDGTRYSFQKADNQLRLSSIDNPANRESIKLQYSEKGEFKGTVSEKLTDSKAAPTRELTELEKFRQGFEKGEYKLPPLQKGWGPYHALKQVAEQNGIKLTHQELRAEAVRIRDRDLNKETGRKHFKVGEQLEFRSSKESQAQPGTDSPAIKTHRDVQGNVTRVERPGQPDLTVSYDAFNKPNRVSDGRGPDLISKDGGKTWQFDKEKSKDKSAIPDINFKGDLKIDPKTGQASIEGPAGKLKLNPDGGRTLDSGKQNEALVKPQVRQTERPPEPRRPEVERPERPERPAQPERPEQRRRPEQRERPEQPDAQRQEQKPPTPEELKKSGFVERKEGDKTTFVKEGQDGSRTVYNQQGRLEELRDASGRSFRFGHNEKGEITRIENSKTGDVFTRKDNQPFFEKQGTKPPAKSIFQVSDNGSLTQRHLDQSNRIEKVTHYLKDGGTFSQDRQGVEIVTAKGTNIRWDVNQQGQATKLTIDGKSWTSQDGKTFTDGKEKFNAQLFPGGLKRDFLDRKPPESEVITTDGRTIKLDENSKPIRPPADRASLEKSTELIDKALAPGRSPDKDVLRQQLEGRTKEELKLISDLYKEKYGKDLGDRFKERFKGADLERNQGLLDGRNDATTDIRVLLLQNGEAGGRDRLTQNKLIETLKTKSSVEIAQIDKQYQERYGISLSDAFAKDPALSDTTKQFLKTYLTGADKRDPKDVLKLADLATNARDLDLFKTVFSDKALTPELREQYLKNGGEKKIADAFGPYTTPLGGTPFGLLTGIVNAVDGRSTLAQRQALDYVKTGRVSADTTLESHRSWLGDNEKAIENTLKNLTPEERRAYLDGKKLAQGDQSNLTEQQRKDLDYYKKVYGVLDKAAGFITDASKAKELAKWEELITNPKGDGFLNKLGEHFGSVYNDGRHKVFDTIHDITKDQWQKLKDDPEHRRQVLDLLKKNYSEKDFNSFKEVLDRKINAKDFEASQLERRPVLESIKDRKGYLYNDQAGILRDLENLTPKEIEEFRKPDSQFRRQLQDSIKEGIGSDHARLAAQDILDQIDRGEKPKQGILTKLHTHATHWVGNTGEVVADVEKAFKEDPKLRERLLDPKTDADKQFSRQFTEALRGALGQDAFDRYGKKLIEQGTLPIADKAEIYRKTNSDRAIDKLTLIASPILPFAPAARLLHTDGDKKGFFESLKTAGPEDFKKIVDGTEKLDFLSKDERQLAEVIAKQQGKTSPEDDLRIALLTGDKAKAKELFAKIPPEKAAETKDLYTKKYGQDLIEGAKELLSGDDLRQSLRALREPPKDAAEAFRRAREDRYDSASGFGKWFVDNFWDGTGDQVVNDYTDFGRELTDHAKEQKEISPEKLKEFDTRIQESLKLFRESKTAAADAAIDALIIAVGVGGSVFTGGVSLGLLATTGLAGALLKVGFKAAVEGKDYDTSLGNILKDAGTGAIDSATAFLGPAQIALLKGLGKATANTTTRGILTHVDDLVKAGGQNLLKDGAGEALEKGLAQRLAVAIGNGEKEISVKSIQSLAKEVATSPEAAAQLEKIIAENLTKGLQKEASTLLKGLAREVSLNSQANLVGGVLNGTLEGVSDWDPAKSFAENLEHFGKTLGTQVILSTGTAAIATPVFKGVAKTAELTGDGVTRVRDLIQGPRHPERPLVRVGDEVPERVRLKDRGESVPSERPHVEIRENEFGGRDFIVNGERFGLTDELSGWRYGKLGDGDPSSVKVHVTTNGAEDLARLQELLIPELNKNKELREIVSAWKTHDPLLKDRLKPGPKDQNAKAFTIYLRSESDAQKVHEILDGLLNKKGLNLDEPFDTGNADHVFGKSNRVGIVREKFDPAVDRDGRLGVLIDQDVVKAIHKRHEVPDGQKISDAKLRQIEKETGIQPGLLRYDNKDRLFLEAGHPSKFHPSEGHRYYLAEPEDQKEFGQLAHRQAYYALSLDYHIDPAHRYVGDYAPPRQKPARESGPDFAKGSDDRVRPISEPVDKTRPKLKPEDAITEPGEQILRKGLKVENRGASPEFARNVQDALDGLPPSIRKLAESGDLKIVIAGRIDDVEPDWKRMKHGPRGYRPGAEYDQVPAYHQPATNDSPSTLVLFERYKAADGSDVHSSDPATVRHFVLHEVGHSIDDALNRPSQNNREFQKAFLEDIQNLARIKASSDLRSGVDITFDAKANKYSVPKDHLTPDLVERLKSNKVLSEPELNRLLKDGTLDKRTFDRLSREPRFDPDTVSYYLADSGYFLERYGLKGIGSQKDTPRFHNKENGIRDDGGRHADGRSEIFAELHAALRGEGPNPAEFLKLFPNSADALKKLLPELELKKAAFAPNQVTPDYLKGIGFKSFDPTNPNAHFQHRTSGASIQLADGRVQYVDAADGVKANFAYNSKGDVTSLELSNGTKYSRGNKDSWTIERPDGTKERVKGLSFDIDTTGRVVEIRERGLNIASRDEVPVLKGESVERTTASAVRKELQGLPAQTQDLLRRNGVKVEVLDSIKDIDPKLPIVSSLDPTKAGQLKSVYDPESRRVLLFQNFNDESGRNVKLSDAQLRESVKGEVVQAVEHIKAPGRFKQSSDDAAVQVPQHRDAQRPRDAQQPGDQPAKRPIDEPEIRPQHPGRVPKPQQDFLQFGDQRFGIRKGDFVLGRADGVDLQLPEGNISRRHAAIRNVDGQAYIRDLDSKAGTYVNGELVTRETPLNKGDRVKLGNYEFIFGKEQPHLPLRKSIDIGQGPLVQGGQEHYIGRHHQRIDNLIVSGDHARLGHDDKGVYIVDTSRNGTLVSRDDGTGRKLIKLNKNEKFHLQEGDEVLLGNGERNYRVLSARDTTSDAQRGRVEQVERPPRAHERNAQADVLAGPKQVDLKQVTPARLDPADVRNYQGEVHRINYGGVEHDFVRLHNRQRTPDGIWRYSSDAWLYGKQKPDNVREAPVKVHVGLGDQTTPDRDLKAVQDALIPLLIDKSGRNPAANELQKLIIAWKTIHPSLAHGGDLAGIQGLDRFIPPGSTNQNAKAFTLYTLTPEDARRVADILDAELQKKGLRLPKEAPTGNVDVVLTGANRVGLVRDGWRAANFVDSDGRLGHAVLLDREIAQNIENELGLKGLSAQEKLSRLRAFEQDEKLKLEPGLLVLDSEKGRLAIKVRPSASDAREWRPGEKQYVGEGKKGADLTDRQAIYKLAKRYQLDPARLEQVDELVPPRRHRSS